MSDTLIHLDNGILSAAIDPLGAELTSLRDAQARELMTDADPRYWTGHAPLLFPIVGRLANDRYRIGGEEFELPQHGFARRTIFELVHNTRTRARLQLESDAATWKLYPFRFRLELLYDLRGSTLATTARVSNLGGEDMPFSFGYHPAFAWPLPYGSDAAAHRILFDKSEAAYVRRAAPGTGLISPEREPSPVVDRELRLSAALFEQDAVIWDDLRSRGLLWGAPNEPNLRIEFPDTPWLGIWQKPGAHYLCIEPWAGMADPMGYTGEIWDKPGILRLKPEETRDFRLNISLIEPDQL